MARRRRRKNPAWGTYFAGVATGLAALGAGLGIYKMVKKPKTPSLGPTRTH